MSGLVIVINYPSLAQFYS